MQCYVQNKHKVLSGDADPLYLCAQKKNADESMTMNTATVDMTGERDENVAIDVWSGYSVDAQIEWNWNNEFVKISCLLCMTLEANLFFRFVCMIYFARNIRKR